MGIILLSIDMFTKKRKKKTSEFTPSLPHARVPPLLPGSLLLLLPPWLAAQPPPPTPRAPPPCLLSREQAEGHPAVAAALSPWFFRWENNLKTATFSLRFPANRPPFRRTDTTNGLPSPSGTKPTKRFRDRPPLTAAAAAFGAVFRRVGWAFGEKDDTIAILDLSATKPSGSFLAPPWTTVGRRRRRFPASFPASPIPETEDMTAKLFLSSFQIRDQFWVRNS